MPVVNNIIRLLDSKKIPYQAYEFPAEKHGASKRRTCSALPRADT